MNFVMKFYGCGFRGNAFFKIFIFLYLSSEKEYRELRDQFWLHHLLKLLRRQLNLLLGQ